MISDVVLWQDEAARDRKVLEQEKFRMELDRKIFEDRVLELKAELTKYVQSAVPIKYFFIKKRVYSEREVCVSLCRPSERMWLPCPVGTPRFLASPQHLYLFWCFVLCAQVRPEGDRAAPPRRCAVPRADQGPECEAQVHGQPRGRAAQHQCRL